MRGPVMVYDALHKKDRCIGPELCGASENPAKRKSNFGEFHFHALG